MGSIAAAEVAKEVIATVRKGKIPNKLKIQQKHGYTEMSARASKAIRTKTYKKTIYPIAKRIAEERERAIEALPGLIGKAKYRDAIDAIDKLTKNHQLLTGGATENIAVKPILQIKDE